MGVSAARWAMELEPTDEGQTEAMMWVEVDLAGIMRAVPRLLKGSIQRVSNREMAAIKAAVESATRAGAESETGSRGSAATLPGSRSAH
jgi:hypothetical protein